MEQVVYTLKQASQMLQVSERSVRNRINKGEIPKVHIFGKILIPAYYFEQFRTGGQTWNLK